MTCRRVTKDEKVCADDFVMISVLRIGYPLSVPDDHFLWHWLVELIFVVRVVSVADDNFTVAGHQLDD